MLARAAYATLLRLATPVYFARLWWRGRHEPPYRSAWGERLGFAGHRVAGTGRGPLWLHAVSLGETRAAEPLIAALRTLRP
ncbi:MAG: glycosyltransferase N-terminal domain-containing protein, partial [Rubrivivax sp.]